MKIVIKAENKEDEERLGAKELGYKGVNDYAVVVRWREGGVVDKEDFRAFGNTRFLMEKFFGLLEEYREAFRRNLK